MVLVCPFCNKTNVRFHTGVYKELGAVKQYKITCCDCKRCSSYHVDENNAIRDFLGPLEEEVKKKVKTNPCTACKADQIEYQVMFKYGEDNKLRAECSHCKKTSKEGFSLIENALKHWNKENPIEKVGSNSALKEIVDDLNNILKMHQCMSNDIVELQESISAQRGIVNGLLKKIGTKCQ